MSDSGRRDVLSIRRSRTLLWRNTPYTRVVARCLSRSPGTSMSAKSALLLPPPNSTPSRTARAAERALSGFRRLGKDLTDTDHPAVGRLARRHRPAPRELDLKDAQTAVALALHDDGVPRRDHTAGLRGRHHRRGRLEAHLGAQHGDRPIA